MQPGKDSFISPQAVIEQPDRVTIGDRVQIKPGVVLRPQDGFIQIGNDVVINHYSVIHGRGGVEIGDWTIIAPHCGIYAERHNIASFDRPIALQGSTAKGITLTGDNLLDGGCQIMDGVTLGKGTVVDAGAIVTHSFPMAVVVAGNPARIVKNRCPPNEWDFNKVERCSHAGMPDQYWPYVKQRVETCRSHLTAGDRVLDLACGEGYMTGRLREHCGKIIGVDYSEDAVRRASEMYPGIEFRFMEASSLAFDDSDFDKVICCELIEHVTRPKARRVIAEILRVLKPGGHLLGSTPSRSEGQPASSTYSHICEYTEAELRELLTPFEHVTVSGAFFTARKPVAATCPEKGDER